MAHRSTEGFSVQKSKAVIAVLLAGAFVAASASDASARWYRHPYYHSGPGPVLGLVGGVLVGAATIATLPFALVGAAVAPRYYGPDPGYYYGPPPPPPRAYYRGYYGPEYDERYGYRRGYYGY
jgi:hypothetical protein